MSPGYLDAAGTRLLGGRDVSWHDTERRPHVAIVNETFARKMWRETPAIGQRFILAGNLTEVVGVAEDGKYHDLQSRRKRWCMCRCRKAQTAQWYSWCGRALAPNEIAAALATHAERHRAGCPVTIQTGPTR